MSQQLEKCPFCGGEPLMSWEHYLSGDELYIRCANDKCLGASFQDSDSEKAIAAWNTRAPESALARSQAECAEALRIINARIQSAIEAECDRCKKKHQLFVEPSTGFYTHTLGGNYCSAHRLHNLLNTEAAQQARAALAHAAEVIK